MSFARFVIGSARIGVSFAQDEKSDSNPIPGTMLSSANRRLPRSHRGKGGAIPPESTKISAIDRSSNGRTLPSQGGDAGFDARSVPIKFRMVAQVIAGRFSADPRKVRAPKSRAVANGNTAQADGKCHRDESCRKAGVKRGKPRLEQVQIGARSCSLITCAGRMLEALRKVSPRLMIAAPMGSRTRLTRNHPTTARSSM